jgi:hypothetical protein
LIRRRDLCSKLSIIDANPAPLQAMCRTRFGIVAGVSYLGPGTRCHSMLVSSPLPITRNFSLTRVVSQRVSRASVEALDPTMEDAAELV